jgi:hypothetical protein
MIPDNLRNEYSMNGNVEIIESYISYGVNRSLYHYSKENVERFIAMASRRESSHYPETDQWLYEALDKYSISKHNTLIIGSEEPYYEGIAIHKGAKVTLVEYQRITSNHPDISCLTVDEFNTINNSYDSAISISSVEHSGLGRYGDELDPDGDIKSMALLRERLNHNGLCFLAVPIGKDQILWNAHRVYGNIRFKKLIDGFEILQSFGLDYDNDFQTDEHLRRINGKKPSRPGTSGGAHQPVFVLRKS